MKISIIIPVRNEELLIEKIIGELEIKLKDEPFPSYGKLFTQPKDIQRVELTHQKGAIAMARAQSKN